MTNPTLDSQAAIPPLANTNSFAQATVSPEFDESLTEKNLDMVRNIPYSVSKPAKLKNGRLC